MSFKVSTYYPNGAKEEIIYGDGITYYYLIYNTKDQVWFVDNYQFVNVLTHDGLWFGDI